MKHLTMKDFIDAEHEELAGKTEMEIHLLLLSRFHKIPKCDIEKMEMKEVAPLAEELGRYMKNSNIDMGVLNNSKRETDKIENRAEILDL